MKRFNYVKTRLAFLAVMLLGFAVNAAAETKFYISDFSISPGETKTIAMNLDTDETNIQKLNGTIVMPEGLSIVHGSFKKSNSRVPSPDFVKILSIIFLPL